MKQPTRKLNISGISLALGIILMIPLFVHAEVNDPTDQTYNSRFKIFTAEHEAVTPNGKIEKIRSIFKIDLETGTVWRYRQGVDQKGKPFEEFFEVPNQ